MRVLKSWKIKGEILIQEKKQENKEENERNNDRLFVSVGFDNGMGRDISRADGSVSVVFDIGGEESRV